MTVSGFRKEVFRELPTERFHAGRAARGYITPR